MNAKKEFSDNENLKNESIRKMYEKKFTDILTSTETMDLLKKTANEGKSDYTIFNINHLCILKYEIGTENMNESKDKLQQCYALKNISKKINEDNILPAYLDYKEDIYNPDYTKLERYTRCLLSLDWSFDGLNKLKKQYVFF